MIGYTVPVNFQVKLDVRALFWRDSDGWQGTTLEVDASASGANMPDVVGRLLATACTAAEADIYRGQVPGRLVPTSLEQKWADVLQRGGTHTFSSIMSNAVSCSEVATNLALHLRGAREDVPALEPIKVRVLVMREHDAWVSQCLEYDLGGEGATMDEAMRSSLQAILAQATLDRVLGKAPLQQVPKAPERFWSIYDSGEAVEWLRQSNDLRPSFRVAS